MRMQPWSLGHGEKEEQVGFDSICGIAHRYGCQHFFNFDGSDIFVCLYYVIVIFIAGACVLTENANIRQLRKKQVLQYDVVLVQKQPVIETESYGAENIRDTKRFYPILGRDVHLGYESTCFLSEEDYKKREIGDTITMTR